MTTRICTMCHHWRPCDCDLTDVARAPDEAALIAAERREDREGRFCPPLWMAAFDRRAPPCVTCGEPVRVGSGWVHDRGGALGWEGLHRRCPDELAAGAWRPMTDNKTTETKP